jgi:hypothetical protein
MVIRAESQRASGNYGIPMTIKSQAETEVSVHFEGWVPAF